MKYEIFSGAGNDFVMLNNLDGIIPESSQAELTVKLCTEKFTNIDGVIFIDKPRSTKAAIRMNYYNRDGSFGAMCGNGARCTAMFAANHSIVSGNHFTLEAVDKLYDAVIISNESVKITFPPVTDYKLDVHIELGSELSVTQIHWMNVGSEHIVIFVDDIMNPKISSIDDVKVNEWGSMLRFHDLFQPKGANVNFIQLLVDNELKIRTYERGVERETLACGTGIISSAVIAGLLKKAEPPVNVNVQSGETLVVDFNIDGYIIDNISLKGSARKIEEGDIIL